MIFPSVCENHENMVFTLTYSRKCCFSCSESNENYELPPEDLVEKRKLYPCCGSLPSLKEADLEIKL